MLKKKRDLYTGCNEGAYTGQIFPLRIAVKTR